MTALTTIIYNPDITGHALLYPVHSFIHSISTLVVQTQTDFSGEGSTTTYWHALELVKQIALFTLSLPIIAPLFAIGCVIKSIQYQYHIVPSAPFLHVIVLEPDQYRQLAVEARNWQRIAQEKSKVASEQQKLFAMAANISTLIAECLENPPRCSAVFDRLLVCKDEKQNLQAIALTHAKEPSITDPNHAGSYLKLAHIVTHPKNIRSIINASEPDRIEKAGTALIKQLAQECLDLKKSGIYAEVVEISKPFYEKLGFTRIPKTAVVMLEPTETPMILKRRKVKKLLDIPK